MKTNGPGVRGPGEPWDASTFAGEPLLISGQMHRTNHFKLCWFLQETTAISSSLCGVLQLDYDGLEFIFGTEEARLNFVYM